MSSETDSEDTIIYQGYSIRTGKL